MKKERILYILIFTFLFSSAHGQINMPGKAKNQTTNRAENRLDQGIDNTLDKIEGGINNVFKKKDRSKNENVEDENEEDANETTEINPVINTKQKLESYTQYDFVPGDKILYFEDFSQVAVGDFPANWTSNGSGEIATVNIAPGNWLHFTTKDGYYCYTKPIEFPENFIMEFDFIPNEDFFRGYHLTFYEDNDNRELNDDLFPGIKGVHVEFDDSRWEIRGYRNETNGVPILSGESDKNPVIKEKVVPNTTAEQKSKNRRAEFIKM